MQNESKLQWCDLTVKIGRKTIVNKDSGHLQPSTMTALLGPSGAGKTSLLNVLTGHSSLNARGKIFFDDKLLKNGSSWPIRGGYVGQKFSAYENQTVYETLKFVCHVRGCDVNEADLLINILGMEDCKYTYISKISGGELKRVSIAVELIGSPRIIFLDEPTSGLDSTTAKNLLFHLRRLALRGASILITLHQPSTEIMEMFHNIHLIAYGTTVYHGTLKNALEYFDSLGFPCSKGSNPCDFLLDLISPRPLLEDQRVTQKRIESLQDAWKNQSKTKKFSYSDDDPKFTNRKCGSHKKSEDIETVSNQQVPSVFKTDQQNMDRFALVSHKGEQDSAVCHVIGQTDESAIKRDHPRINNHPDSNNHDYEVALNGNYKPSILSKFYHIYRRGIIEKARKPRMFISEGIFMLLSVLITIYFAATKNERIIFVVKGFIQSYIFLFAWFNGAMEALVCLPSEWSIILRERKSNLYDGFTGYFGRLYSMATFRILINLTYITSMMFAAQLVRTFQSAFLILFVCTALSIFMMTFCLTLSTFFKSTRTSQVIGIILLLLLLGIQSPDEADRDLRGPILFYAQKIAAPMYKIKMVTSLLMFQGSIEELDFLQRDQQSDEAVLSTYNPRTRSSETGTVPQLTPITVTTSLGIFWLWMLILSLVGPLYLHIHTRQRMVIKPPKK